MTRLYRYLCVIAITTFCISAMVPAHAGDTATVKKDAAIHEETSTTAKEGTNTPKEEVTTLTEDTSTVTVEDGVICKDVVDYTPMEPGTSFAAFVERLYCFTKIVGAIDPIEITHVWFYGNTERARVTLAVNSPLWRTYSSKIIQPHEIGLWNVVVIDQSENVLESFSFTILEE